MRLDEESAPARSSESQTANTPTNPSDAKQKRALSRLAIIAVIVLIGSIAYAYSDRISLDALVEREAELLAYRDQNPFAVVAITFCVYVAVTGLSIPGASGLSLAIGWYLGFWRGFVLVSFASTAGATVAFLLSRFVLRDWIQQRYPEQVRAFNRAFERDGVQHLITLRLIPAVPFFVVNVVMGLTPLKVSTFWWASQIGMIPGTAAYLFAGASLGSIRDVAERGAAGIITPRLFLAFVVLAMLPITIKYAKRRFQEKRAGDGNHER